RKRPQRTAKTWKVVANDANAAPPNAGAAGPIVSLGGTLNTECPVRDPIVEGLIDRGQIVVVAARPGTGKTPFLTQMVSAVASGQPVLGMPTKRCRVGLIDLESDPRRHRQLLQRQWVALRLDPNTFCENIDLFIRGNPNDSNSCELDRVMTISNQDR